MAKKNGGSKTHTLLKAWGIAACMGLFACLATYNENAKPISIKKKPWQVALISALIAVAIMGILMGVYFLLRRFFFPEFTLESKWVLLIYVAVTFIIGVVVSVVDSVQSRNN